MFDLLINRIASKLEPETAHGMAVKALANGYMPLPVKREYASLATEALGMTFANPIGLAAGFDKNAEVYKPMLQAGFGFVEVGTVTPKPQSGNPRPRLFRLAEDRGVINRLGFNNEGAAAMHRRLPPRHKMPGIVGVNIGRNKDSEDGLADYLALLHHFYDRASYITVNISSPNTPGLRELQKKEQLSEFLRGVMRERRSLFAMKGYGIPLLVKIAPDLSDSELFDIVELALEERVDGLIIGNTTLSRPSLQSQHKEEKGGLSGAPLFALSTDMLRKTRALAGDKLTLIGVGGVSTGAEALEKIRAGANLVQLYTALVYEGFSLAEKIKREMVGILAEEGTTLAELSATANGAPETPGHI